MKKAKGGEEEKNKKFWAAPGAVEKANGEDEGSAEDKKEDEEEDKKEDEGESEDEGEETEKCAKKSLTPEDLEKGLQRLENLAGRDNPHARKESLLQKAQESTLSKAEREELYSLLGGEETQSELADEVTKSFSDNDTLEKALDVSDFLRESTEAVVQGLTTLAKSMEASDNRQHEFNLVLAKAVSDMGRIQVAISKRLGVLEEQPARAPKSRGVSPMQKSFAGRPAQGDTLSKSEILAALEEMTMESVQKGLGGATEDGVDLAMATSKYEQFNTISEGLLASVQKFVQDRRSAAH